MLSKWFPWQYVAPDEEYEKAVAQQPPATEDGWSFVAPIEKPLDGSPPPAAQVHDEEQPLQTPEPTGPQPPPINAFDNHGNVPSALVRCINCNQMTPVKSPPKISTPDPEDSFKTPPPTVRFANNISHTVPVTKYEREAQEGSQQAIKVFLKTTGLTAKENKVLRFCSSTAALNDTNKKILEKIVKNDPDVARARAKELGDQAKDGHTPLMVAARSGNLKAVKIIMDYVPEAHLDRDFFGATALHYAAYEGEKDIVDILVDKHQEYGQNIGELVDLNGQTPLGRIMTSPKPKARENKEQINRRLFSPEDCSIRGTPAAPIMRASVDPSLKIAYGTSDMPGQRINMEDATCTETWEISSGKKYCLLGVCDGHGDQGKVSEYVAEKLATLVRQQTMDAESPPDNWQKFWTTICLEVDKSLQNTDKEGGSTAVLALITPSEIVVANVGDSRCILVQKGSSDQPPPLVEELATGEESKEDTAEEPESTATATTNNDDAAYSVIAMSEDHKPNLPNEQERIENAKAEVIAETFEEDGAQVTIHKVQVTVTGKKNKMDVTHKMAVSRSFGDSEYKKNKELGPDEQAVVAVPEVRVHPRDADSDMYLVLACDGVWDVMSNDDVARYVVENVKKMDEEGVRGGLLPTVGDNLLRECFQKGSQDNMTVVVAALSKSMDTLVGGAVEGTRLVFASPEPKKQVTP